MASKRYIVYSGDLRSRNDGEWHYVPAREVARLYGVNPAECIMVVDEWSLLGVDRSRYIELHPDPFGNYKLPNASSRS